jgi:Holliday junction DNA helicase RuvA
VYDHLRGTLTHKSPGAAVLEAGGVGYRLRISLATFERLPAAGSECRLLARLIVREDALELAGFADEAERRVFDVLTSVSGVGPSLALAALSALRPAELAEAVRSGNAAALRRIKGLGEKKAERVILELRDKVEYLAALEEPSTAPAGAGRAPAGAAADAAEALVALGYRRPEAEEAVARAVREMGRGAAVQEIIRRALTHAG